MRKVTAPKPTHSKYYSRNPEKLDLGVQKWVSMAEALSWGATVKPSHTITGGNGHGVDRYCSGGANVRQQCDELIGTSNWLDKPVLSSADLKHGTQRFEVADAARLQTYPVEGWGLTDRPDVTVVSSVGRGLAGGSGARKIIQNAMNDGTFIDSPHGDGSSFAEKTKITPTDAGQLQSYPRPFRFGGSKTAQYLQIGNAVPPLLARKMLEHLIK